MDGGARIADSPHVVRPTAPYAPQKRRIRTTGNALPIGAVPMHHRPMGAHTPYVVRPAAPDIENIGGRRYRGGVRPLRTVPAFDRAIGARYPSVRRSARPPVADRRRGARD